MLQGGKARELAAFLQAVTQEGAVVLPDAAQKAAAFHAVVHSLVYDVLMSKVSSRSLCPMHIGFLGAAHSLLCWVRCMCRLPAFGCLCSIQVS